MITRTIKQRQPWSIFLIKAVLVFVVLVASAQAFAARYRIAYDPQKVRCLPDYSVYLIDRWDKQLERGGLYAFYAKGLAPFFVDGTKMIKKLAALPGDNVSVRGSGMFVNNNQVAAGLELSEPLGRSPESFYVSGVLDQDSYWFAGEHELSFDSRYWGVVKNEQITGKAYALF